MLHDFRYAIRMLTKSPGFTAVAVLSLALGIGANTAIFSAVNTLLFRPLPAVEDPGRLAWMRTSLSYPNYLDFRDQNQVFTGLAAHQKVALTLTGSGGVELVQGQIVSANFFEVLGARPALGRTFLPDEEQPGAPAVTVLSHAFWKRRFNGDPGAAGRTIHFNGLPFTVIGVAPPEFNGVEVGMVRDAWVTLGQHEPLLPRLNLKSRGVHVLGALGRLKPGLSLRQAEANLRVVAGRIDRTYPDQEMSKRIALLPVTGGLDPRERDEFVVAAALLQGVVVVVLLAACANLATLLMARAGDRAREIGVRLAIGAGRARVVRQLLSESLLLSLLGGAMGVLLALWLVDLISNIRLATSDPIVLDFRLDYQVLWFAAGLSALTTLLFGLAPALQASRLDLAPVLKGEGGAGGGSRRSRLRNGFVIAQVTLSLVVLIGAGLFLRSLGKASALDTGFAARDVVLLPVNVGLQRYSEERGRRFYDRLLESLRATPGVRAASLVTLVPLGLSHGAAFVTREGKQGDDNVERAGLTTVAPGYFETLAIPILQGRDFSLRDTAGAPPVVVINESMARLFWPGQSAVGQRISFSAQGGPYMEVIGVVKDGKYRSLGERPRPFLYLALAQHYEGAVQVVVGGDPRANLGVVRDAVRALDPGLAAFAPRTISDHLGIALFPSRAGAVLLGSFGLVVLALAVAGIYGVTAYSASRRTQEIGVRMALGAQRRHVLGLIVGQGMRLVLTGVGLGLAASAAATRVFSSFLYGVSPTDPLVFAAISTLLAAVAAAACYLPARRASRVDPAVALRYE
jgi:predicted permease